MISNGPIQTEYLRELDRYVTQIYYRDDYGFDAGAFRDFFLRYCTEYELREWDQIVIFNDSFYGPFTGWDDLFTRMEQEKLDFWGLLDESKLIDGIKYHYLCSYFLVFCKASFCET